MNIGDTLCDMHGRNFHTHERLAEQVAWQSKPTAKWEIRSPIEWVDETEPAKLRLWEVLNRVCKDSGYGAYCNKMLVIIGAALNEDGWMVAAYSYDGRRCGICEVKARP